MQSYDRNQYNKAYFTTFINVSRFYEVRLMWKFFKLETLQLMNIFKNKTYFLVFQIS